MGKAKTVTVGFKFTTQSFPRVSEDLRFLAELWKRYAEMKEFERRLNDVSKATRIDPRGMSDPTSP